MGFVSLPSDQLSSAVIGACFEVARVLKSGFLEKVYEKALELELTARGVRVERQVPLTVYYKGNAAGNYYADLVVEGALVVELKCVGAITHEHVAQSLNYLRASGLGVCLLVNFERSRVEWRRVVAGKVKGVTDRHEFDTDDLG